MLILPIFECKFSDLSHGFRPKKSCHIALNVIRKNGNRTIWFIKLDLVKAFDKVHHSLLMEEIKTKIVDLQMIDLIHKMLKVWYINSHDILNSKLEIEEGTPQSSILSPFFVNILFDRLDRWIEINLLTKYNVPRKNSINSQYYISVNKHLETKWNNVLEVIKNYVLDANRKKS